MSWIWVSVAAALAVVGCGGNDNASRGGSGAHAGASNATGGSGAALAAGGAAGSSTMGGAAGSSAMGGAAGSSVAGGAAGSSATGGAAGSSATGGAAGSSAAGGAAGSSAAGGAAGSPWTGGAAGSLAMGGVSGGAAGAVNAGAGSLGDVTPPTVLSVSPDDGATGVRSDAEIVIEFSEPMNQSATVAAFQSADLPDSAVEFEWNGDGTTLTITPLAPLPYAEGTDEGINALTISFTITNAAEDLAGNQKASAETFSFDTLRRITRDVGAALTMSGHVREDGDVTGIPVVGDTNFNMELRALLTHSLSLLPSPDTAEYLSADVLLTESEIRGTPAADLGELTLVSVAFETLGLTAFSVAADSSPRVITLTSPVTTIDVLSLVVADLEAGAAETQLRMQYATPTDGNDDFDFAMFALEMPLRVVYLLP